MENQNSNETQQEFEGKNLEDAILHAEHKLKLQRTEFNYEVVAEKTRLFGGRPGSVFVRLFFVFHRMHSFSPSSFY